MTAAEMLPLLQAWAKRHAELSAPMDQLAAVFGGSFDGPLFDAVWGAWHEYTGTLSLLIGDEQSWLHWYEHENAMGRKGLRVTWYAGQPGFKVRNLRHLARVIVECRSA